MVHSKEVHGIFMNIFMGVLYIFSLVYEQLVNIKLLAYKLGISGKEKLNHSIILYFQS